MITSARKRHIAKALTWRLVGTVDTFLLGWLLTGRMELGAAIGGTEVVTKLLLYYFHERIWFNARVFKSRTSRTRHLIKTFTWRMVGTLDTMILSWLISGDPMIGVQIGGLELLTKMLLYYLHERIWHRSNYGLSEEREPKQKVQPRSTNLFEQGFQITRESRNHKNRHASFMVFFTGLSGSGKSTIAEQLEIALHMHDYQTYLLDGDNIRLGINNDLGFSPEDRSENLRRIAEVGKLMVDAGMVCIGAFVSPLRADREKIRHTLGPDSFIEVFVDTPLEVCEQRDVKGLYAKARRGEIPDFTGISAPYEAPINPEITIKTTEESPEEAVQKILSYLKAYLNPGD